MGKRWFRKRTEAKRTTQEATVIHNNTGADQPVSSEPAGAPLDRATSTLLTLQRKVATLEEVRSLLSGQDIEGIPGIVVIGAQSGGKSSLLESMSGIAFPRAEGMCTLCPTIVSLEVDPCAEP